jgi:hypothetical protein
MILMQEYSPKEIIFDMSTRTATITIQSYKIMEEIMNKYTEMTTYRNPEFILWKHIPEIVSEGYQVMPQMYFF